MSFNILLKTQLERLMDKLFSQIYTYGTCTDAKNVMAKTVTAENFILKKGARIYVLFSNSSKEYPLSGYLTMNVNNTGSKNVIVSDYASQCGYLEADYFFAGKIQEFVYDGTNWVWIKELGSGGGGGTITDADALITVSEFEDIN